MKARKTFYLLFLIALGSGCGTEYNNGSESISYDDLFESFQAPPDDCRPKVLWDWMGGQISREGITADLESMEEAGIGGVMVMQMPDQCPYPRRWSYSDYPGKVKCLSDEWFDMINHAIGECDRLGLEFSMFMCPGWSHCGSLSITPENGLKKLVSVDLLLEGPVDFNDLLPMPEPIPGTNGGNDAPVWSSDYKEQPRVTDPFYKDVALFAIPEGRPGEPVSADAMVYLTGKLDPSGVLRWKVPEGNWRVMRLGMASENGMNHPAPVEGTGLECDRFDPEAVKIVFDEIVGRIQKEAKAKGYSAFKEFETDSYEAGYQDFGKDFQEVFQKRRGYDCTPWLPVWTDMELVIDSEEKTSRFRFDMQRTIDELWTERFHETLRKLGDENDLTWVTEPYFLLQIDWRTSGARSLRPGNEFWVRSSVMNELGPIGPAPGINALYGQSVTWAEAFTAEPDQSAWRNDPWLLKPFGDRAFCEGINQFYMHGFIHNPFADKYQPGFTMGYWGTQFCRHQTWWPMSGAWHTYLARCQYMLRRGIPVIDVANYPAKKEHIPTEFSYAGRYRTVTLNDETLLKRITVEDGRLVLPDGNSFAALTLENEQPVRPEALEKIEELVRQGAVLIGEPPLPHPPGLEYGPEGGARMKATIDALWGGDPPGKGKVLSGKNAEAHLDQLLGGPDFLCRDNTAGQIGVASMHRTTGDIDFWFVAHEGDEKLKTELRFRVGGRIPEFWDPVTGMSRTLPEFREEDGFTVIPFEFNPRESGFFVFAEKSSAKQYVEGRNIPIITKVLTVEGPWKVSFNQDLGGPAGPVIFDELSDWTLHSDQGIRYYSGIATYSVSFNAEGSSFDSGSDQSDSDDELWISLGRVKNVARIIFNGEDLGTCWCAPWSVSLPADLLKSQGNQLQIRVANTWVNRLIGDEQEPEDCELAGPDLWFSIIQENGQRMGGYNKETPGRGLKDLPGWLLNDQPRPSQGRYTFTSWRYYDAEAPLLPSGLLGPVEILSRGTGL